MDPEAAEVKSWVRVVSEGAAADPVERWEKAYELQDYIKRTAAAISRVQQSHFNLIKHTTSQVTAEADYLEALFVSI